MLESEYQAKLIKTLRRLFDGCIILKNDTDYQQGIPDLSVLWHNKWAFLEVKPDKNAPEEPNQRWFIMQANMLSFGAFIYPQNEKEVLDDLQQAFGVGRPSRRSVS